MEYYSKQQQSKMKSLDLKIEKANSIFKHRRLHKLTNLFRFMEAFAFLLFMVSRFSNHQLPFAAVKLSGDYFRGITLTVLSPKFVFLIGNLIILILFLQKSRIAEIENSDENGKTDLCYDYVKNCETIVSNTTIVTSSSNSIVDVDNKKKTKICRSRSENPIRGKCEEEKRTYRKLRRSVTEMSRSESFGHGGDTAARRYVKEELSSEDFRRTVEDFIARQQKILRDEEFSPMVYIGA